MATDKEAFDRAVSPSGPVGLLIKQALRYLEDRVKEVEAKCPGNSSSTSSESTKTTSEPAKTTRRSPARTAGSRSKKDPAES